MIEFVELLSRDVLAFGANDVAVWRVVESLWRVNVGGQVAWAFVLQWLVMRLPSARGSARP